MEVTQCICCIWGKFLAFIYSRQALNSAAIHKYRIYRSPIYFIFQTQAISSLHVVVIPFCIYNIFKKTDQPISKKVYPGLTGGQAITVSCTSADIVT